MQQFSMITVVYYGLVREKIQGFRNLMVEFHANQLPPLTSVAVWNKENILDCEY